MTNSAILTPAEVDLTDLAQLINQSHIAAIESHQAIQAIFEGASNYLNKKRQVGEYLLQANRQIRHGQWLLWLQQNCPDIPKSTAYDYMYIAKNWNEIGIAAAELRNATKLPSLGNLGIVKAMELLRKSDEVVDAELIDDEDEENLEIAVDTTPLTTQQEVHTSREEVAFYKPLMGDTIKINDVNHDLNGQEVEVHDVIDNGAIVLFKTENGERGHVFNEKEGIIELVTRPYTPPPVADKKSTESRLASQNQVASRKSQVATEKDLLDSALEKIDIISDWGRRMIHCCLAARMPDQDLLDEGIEILEIEI